MFPQGTRSGTSKNLAVFVQLQNCANKAKENLPVADIQFTVINRYHHLAGVFKGALLRAPGCTCACVTLLNPLWATTATSGVYRSEDLTQSNASCHDMEWAELDMCR